MELNKMLDEIHLFIQIVDCGSFTKAAEKLNLYQSTVSRKMLFLEKILNTQLFVRNVKRMELTQNGRFLYTELRDNIMELIEKTKTVNDKHLVLSGTFSMIIPPFVILSFMEHELAEFIRTYDSLKIEIFTSFTDLNNMQHNFDLAITPFFPNIGYYTSQRLFSASFSLYATPSYLKEAGTPQRPEELLSHKLFIPKFDNILLNKWTMFDQEEQPHLLEIIPFFIYDSTIVAEQMVHADLGISILFDKQVQNKLAAGELVQVLPEYHFKEMNFYLIKPSQVKNPKVDFFVKFLQQKNPQLFG